MATGETIVAQASAQGSSQYGVVRLSGQESLEAVAPIFYRRRSNEKFPPDDLSPRIVSANNIVENVDKKEIVLGWLTPWMEESADPLQVVRCELFYWPKGRGFTGERAVELHLPGAPAILDSTVRSILASKHARLANRGEFTLRSFLSGRIDLTQAEAVLGTIEAESDHELRNALTQLSGNLSRDFAELREKLFDVLCDLEAGFDFADEDIEFISASAVKTKLQEAKSQIEETLIRARTKLGADQTPRVALIGSPNAGKSSLFNALVRRFGDAASTDALVSEEAGTTRDYLEEALNIDGVHFLLVDSAGVESKRTIEAVGNAAPRALAQRNLAQVVANASLIVYCVAPDVADSIEEKRIETLINPKTPVVRVTTKHDLNSAESFSSVSLATSATTGYGIEKLAAEIVGKLKEETENGEIVPSTALRCQEALSEALDALQNALTIMDDQLGDDFLLASEIRVALDRVGIVTGQVHTDDLLDRIFSRFCIGK